MSAPIRKFDTGATRNADEGKLDFEGFLSPLVLERYAKYMDSHRRLPDGSLRDSDNWQRGIPLSVYIKSAWRHFFDLWREHRGIATPDGLENDACALLFNISGYLHEHLKASTNQSSARVVSSAKAQAKLYELLSAEELKGFGIPAELSYLASFSPNRSPVDAFIIGMDDPAHPLHHAALDERTPEDRL